MEGGVRPAASRLTNLVSDVSNWLARSGEGHPTASLIWLGRRPEGPGAETLGKDLAPLRTPDSLKMIGGGTGPMARRMGQLGGASAASHLVCLGREGPDRLRREH